MRRIPFHALREDILPVLELVEQEGPLQYVRTGNQLSSHFEMFLRGRELPDLGIADQGTGSGCKSYLVTKTTVQLTVRMLMGTDGVQRFLMDQLLNPDSVRLTPAGMWGDDVLLAGIVDTVSDSDIAQELMKRFNSAFRKHFGKIKAYRVDSQALALLKAEKRLTDSAQSPREFDLTTPA
jgi:hypothetical protein